MADVEHRSEPRQSTEMPETPVETLDVSPTALGPTLPDQTESQDTSEDDVAQSSQAEETEEKPEVPPKDEPQQAESEPQTDGPPTIQEPPIDDTNATDSRLRSDSRSTTATFMTQKSGTVSSTVLIVTALEKIAASRDARRDKKLEDATQVALTNIKQTDGQPIDPELIFRSLHLASKTLSVSLQVTALDCIGKLITYSYFAFPSAQTENQATTEKAPLIERAIDAICDCFENEATAVEIQQQIIKSLLAAVLNDKIVVHGAGLLKAVRQIYNIFIYSKSSQNQQIAQGSLTQMVSTVFERVRTRLDLKELRLRYADKPSITLDASASDVGHNSDAASMSVADQPDQPVAKDPNVEKLTLQSFESPKEVTTVNDNAPTTVTRTKRSATRSMSGISEEKYDDSSTEDELDEVYVKDAFLVFRALCKLSHKVLTHEQQQDVKSQNMRSKLLSLHLIHYLINNHTATFTSNLAAIKNSSSSMDTLLLAVRPHLCLSLSRNGSSAVPHVFKVCCEIFWLMLKDMRVMMKKELEVFLKEIYLAILEKRSAPVFQKQYFMEILERLGGDPRALVEIYLNYDCDRTALENIFQKYVLETLIFLARLILVASLNSCPDTPAYRFLHPLLNNISIKNSTLR